MFFEAANEIGVPIWREEFADRRYTPERYLVPCTQADAVIESEDEAVTQALRMTQKGEVLTSDGGTVKVHADTLCIHVDSPKALEFAKKIKALL